VWIWRYEESGNANRTSAEKSGESVAEGVMGGCTILRVNGNNT